MDHEHGMNCPARTPNSDEFCTCGLEWRIEIDRLRAALEVCAGSMRTALEKDDAPMSADVHLIEAMEIAERVRKPDGVYSDEAAHMRTVNRLSKEVESLRVAIATHHAQKADDRCWMDDDVLYAAAGLPPVDRRVGDKAAMMVNCARFIETRCEGGKWMSYAELETEKNELLAEISRMRGWILERDIPKAMLDEMDRIRGDNGELRAQNKHLVRTAIEAGLMITHRPDYNLPEMPHGS